MSTVKEFISVNQPAMANFPLVKLWSVLTTPSAEMENPEQRRRARFLLALNAIVIPLGLIAMILSAVLGRTEASDQNVLNTVNLIGAVHLILLIIGYVMGRSAKYYTSGALVTLLAISSASMFTSLQSPEDTNTLVVWITFSVFTASLLLTLQDTIMVAVLNNMAIFLLPLLSSEIPLEVVIDVWLFILIMSILIIISASIREKDLQQIESQAESIRESLRRLEEANRLKSQFLATMSHELRTPLNAIIGFAEVMMMGLAGKMEEKAVHTTQRIHHNGQRLLHLIDDLLDISKIEAGRLDVIYSPFEPTTLVENVERTMKPQALDKGVDFICKVDPALPTTMLGDMQRLEQIVYNLVSNAVKFTEQGSIHLSLQKSGDKWCIEVTDSGIGIAAHAQEYVFDKFRQVDGSTSRTYKGTGLGLAIVKELTLLMRGVVNLESEPGKGSKFTVTLPIHMEEPT